MYYIEIVEDSDEKCLDILFWKIQYIPPQFAYIQQKNNILEYRTLKMSGLGH